MKRLIVVGMLLLTMLAACSTPATDAVRTIEVTMTDDLRYDPEAITVTAGETVRFVVRNEGAAVHEFLIGTEEEQAAFEAEMSDGHGDDHGDEAGVSVDPGAAGEFSYTFAEPGELLIGCHEPGHYDGGMVAVVTVEG